MSGAVLNLTFAAGVVSVDFRVPNASVELVIPVPHAIAPEKDADKTTEPGGTGAKKSEHRFTLVPLIDACAFRVNE